MFVYATGPREGKTFRWGAQTNPENQFHFVDGRLEIPNNNPDLLQYLRVNLAVRTEFEMAPPVSQPVVDVDKVETDPLRIAILKLDATNDKCWTEEGKPAIDVLAGVMPNVQRRMVDKVASDLTRDVVARRQAEMTAADTE